MSSTLIVNARLVNDGQVRELDVLIRGQRIERIGDNLQSTNAEKVVDARGSLLFPGVIDDQVHFREPGLTHKATIRSESRAAVAGGVTSYMEMPNTIPPAFTQDLLEHKYRIASCDSLANYSFYMGAGHDNLAEVLKTDASRVCGLKIFMGSSTGNLLVDDPAVLEAFFSRVPFLIAMHCEHEPTIRRNLEKFRAETGNRAHARVHPLIRSEDGCYLSSSLAVNLAQKFGTRLHILHLSSAKEMALFRKDVPLAEKKITAEACIHHLWFCDEDYERLGNLIKWNPAIKTAHDREGIWEALLDGRIDVVATDHAPHTWDEKQATYFDAPSGGPMIQHSLVAMLEFHHQGKISLPMISQKMAHNPATIFRMKDRGFIREGYFADLVMVDPDQPWKVGRDNILAKCGWSPFEGNTFRSRMTRTWVSGNLCFENGGVVENEPGMRLEFIPPG